MPEALDLGFGAFLIFKSNQSVAAGGREERGLKEGDDEDEDEDEDDGRVGHRPRGG